MQIILVDTKLDKTVCDWLPAGNNVHVVDFSNIPENLDWESELSPICVLSHVDGYVKCCSVFADTPLASVPVLKVDPERQAEAQSELTECLLAANDQSQRRASEMRLASAQLRRENMEFESRMREIERLLYSLGNPQFSNALSWLPSGVMVSLEAGDILTQRLPISIVGLTSIDLWFPHVIMPMIADLSVSIESSLGETHLLSPVEPNFGLEAGWVRFVSDEPVAGPERDSQLRLVWSGSKTLTLALSKPVADLRFRSAVSSGVKIEETLSLRAWHSLGGVRLPACTPVMPGASVIKINEAEFVYPSSLPSPALFAQPPLISDHVSAAYWENEDTMMVHASRHGVVCAIIRGAELNGLTHISALVTSGHPQAPCLNFAIGVAPAGELDSDGFWQKRLGPWLTGIPPQGWGQAHCIPMEPIPGKADILLAVSLANDAANNFSWGQFRGFRVSRG